MIEAVIDKVSPLWAIFLILLFSPSLLAEWAEKLPILGRLSKRLRGRLSQMRASERRKADLEQVEADRTASFQKQEREIERLSGVYDRLEEDFQEMQERVDRLEEKLTLANRRLFAAVAYIRDLLATIQRLDPDHEVKQPPDLLKDVL